MRIPNHLYLFVRFADFAISRPNLEPNVGGTHKDFQIELSTIVLFTYIIPVFMAC